MTSASYDLPTLGHALARLKQHPVEVKGMISLGAGRGNDMRRFAELWPGASTLLIDMDPSFEAGYRELQKGSPLIHYDICGAAAEDRQGFQSKSDQFGGVIVTGAQEASEDLIATPFKRLDTLVREHGIAPPYFLKFDTHGVELDILAGGEEVLKQTSLIMMEAYNFKLGFTGGKNLTFDEMCLHMRGLGFRVIDIVDPLYRPGDAALWQVHLLFARADHPAFKSSSYSAPSIVAG